MIQRAYNTLCEVTSSVFISVASDHIHYDIPADHLIDHPGYAGPLAGIHAALQAASTTWVLVLAVDLPHVQPYHLSLLLEARVPSADAIISTTQNRTQPLCACYHTRTLPKLEALLNQKQFRVSTFLNSLNVKQITFNPESLINLNTPVPRTRNPKPET